MKRITVIGMLALFLGFSSLPAQDNYKIDRAHSTIGFKVSHMVVSKVRGKFNEFDATFKYHPTDISQWHVEAVIKTASIDTDNKKRDDHLRNPDFFDAAKYPEIRFVSKRFEKTEDGYVVIGDLTMRGVTREIRIPFEFNGPITDPWGNQRIGVEGKTKVDRFDYNIRWSKTMDNGGLVVGRTVTIEINAEFIKAAQ